MHAFEEPHPPSVRAQYKGGPVGTLWFQQIVLAGKQMTRLENGLNIGDRASGFGVNIKGVDWIPCLLP